MTFHFITSNWVLNENKVMITNKISRVGDRNMLKKTAVFSSEKNNKVGSNKKTIHFILESKETGDIWTESRDFNEMQSKYNPIGWTYSDITGTNGCVLLETISKSEFQSVLKMLNPVPLGFKVKENLKRSLEKIAESKGIGLIDVTTEAIQEYINNNKNLIDQE
ncbi:hypothetical protein Amet_1542 [Alkaliphilus metalliredigens QYMF]|uniref:Uncharacterized protein n=1 Tax=Alkaliphilus metalliredigens (strain QYMF) TaxID=293826 RepID=A6TNG1_ALKMQ|nr:hypothetical protein [Alkaliphilus metalliredigens]ABR47729.1 hypothetical protein Amet_1542 [Alkaliphilus metalliredigens QYMF]